MSKPTGRPVRAAAHISHSGDPRVAPFLLLKESERASRRADQVVAEGTYVVERLLRSGRTVESVLCTPPSRQRMEELLSASGAELLVAPSSLVREITGFAFHRGIVALAPRWQAPPVEDVARPGSVTLALDGIADPENVGAVFRTAAALGAGGLLVGPRCADPLYRRSVRVSMGHVFTLPFATVGPDSWGRQLRALASRRVPVVALTPDSGATPLRQLPAGMPGGCVVVLGAEGDGLSAESLSAATVAARIEMAPGTDSLNVAASAAIALYHLAAPVASATVSPTTVDHQR